MNEFRTNYNTVSLDMSRWIGADGRLSPSCRQFVIDLLNKEGETGLKDVMENTFPCYRRQPIRAAVYIDIIDHFVSLTIS